MYVIQTADKKSASCDCSSKEKIQVMQNPKILSVILLETNEENYEWEILLQCRYSNNKNDSTPLLCTFFQFNKTKNDI